MFVHTTAGLSSSLVILCNQHNQVSNSTILTNHNKTGFTLDGGSHTNTTNGLRVCVRGGFLGIGNTHVTHTCNIPQTHLEHISNTR